MTPGLILKHWIPAMYRIQNTLKREADAIISYYEHSTRKEKQGMYVRMYVRGLVEYSLFTWPTSIYWAVIMCQVIVLSIVDTLINKKQSLLQERTRGKEEEGQQQENKYNFLYCYALLIFSFWIG